jgi:hypothetical protein
MRRQRILGFTAVAGFALLLGHGIAAAQAQGPATRPPDATAGITRQVNLSPQEQLTQGESMLTRMDSSRNMVRQALEKARLQRDVVKTLCLNDKLNQLDVAIRSARERRESLGAAVQRSDVDLANHEFTILSVLRQRTDQLSAEANQCIGSTENFAGDMDVKVSIDKGIPDDPSQFSDNPGTVVAEPPSCTSCVK